MGAEEPVPTDARVVSASDADLEAAVAAERFRSPLLHRLAGFEIDLPPLRQRREDLGRLLSEADEPSATPMAEGTGTGGEPPETPRRRPDEIGGEELLAALEASRFRPYAAARRLGISRASVYDLMAKHPEIRTAAELDREQIDACRERCGGDLEAMAGALKVSPLGLRRRMAELGLLG